MRCTQHPVEQGSMFKDMNQDVLRTLDVLQFYNRHARKELQELFSLVHHTSRLELGLGFEAVGPRRKEGHLIGTSWMNHLEWTAGGKTVVYAHRNMHGFVSRGVSMTWFCWKQFCLLDSNQTGSIPYMFLSIGLTHT